MLGAHRDQKRTLALDPLGLELHIVVNTMWVQGITTKTSEEAPGLFTAEPNWDSEACGDLERYRWKLICSQRDFW